MAVHKRFVVYRSNSVRDDIRLPRHHSRGLLLRHRVLLLFRHAVSDTSALLRRAGQQSERDGVVGQNGQRF